MKIIPLLTSLALTAPLLVGSGIGSTSASHDSGAGEDSLRPAAAAPGSKVSILEADFTKHVDFGTALKMKEAYKGDVVGVRFENDQVVGEYFMGSDKSPTEFLAQFREMYGTEPEVDSLLVAVPYRAPLDGLARSSYEPLPDIAVSTPEFIAPKVPEENFLELRAASRASAARAEDSLLASASPSATTSFTPTWEPEVVYAGTQRSGSSQYFYNSLDW